MTVFDEETIICGFVNLIFFFETVLSVSSIFHLKYERKSGLEIMFSQEQNTK